MQRKRIAEVALQQLQQVAPVLYVERLVQSKLSNEDRAHRRVPRAFIGSDTGLAGGDMNQDEHERDDSEDDSNGCNEAPQEPHDSCHLSLHAISIDQSGRGDPPAAQQRRP